MIKQKKLIIIFAIFFTFLLFTPYYAKASSPSNVTQNNLPTAKGVDISMWNIKNRDYKPLDFNLLKQSGYSFVIIKISKRDTKSKIATGIDPYFNQFYDEAKAAGLKVGAYVFSYAKNESDAIKEAQAAIKNLNGRPLDLPIAYDMENNDNINKVIKKGKEFASNVVLAFTDEIEESGYDSMIYTGLYFYNSYLDYDMLSDLKIWIAQYPKINNNMTHKDIMPLNRFKKPYYIWQYSSTVDAPGVSYPGKGGYHCDVNYIFDPKFSDPDFLNSEENNTDTVAPKDESNNTLNSDIYPTNISFTTSNISLSLSDAKNYKLDLSVEPVGANSSQISYFSSNDSIASVDNNGNLTAYTIGSVAITASYNGLSTTMVVNITDDEKIKSIELVNDSIDMLVDEKANIDVLVSPVTLSKKLTFTSNNPDIASVDKNGTVTALKSGEAKITVSGDNISKVVTIYIDETEVINDNNGDKTNNKKDNKINKSKKDKNSSKNDIKDNDKNIVNNKRSDNKKNNTETKKDKPKNNADIYFTTKKVVVGKGEKYQFTVNTKKGINKDDIKWFSSDTDIAYGLDSGLINAKNTGRIYIDAKLDNTKDTARALFVIKNPPTSFKLSLPKKQIKKGQSMRIKPVFKKGQYANKVTYKSSNKNILAVSKKGNIRAVKKGSATIIGKSYNGVISKLKVTVK